MFIPKERWLKKSKFMKHRNFSSESLHELPMADSGFPPRQKNTERKSFKVFDPERYPISMINAFLDDLEWANDDGDEFLTRTERTTLEHLRDAPAVDATTQEAQREAADKLKHYERSTRRVNILNQVLATIVEIAEIHARAGIDAGDYLQRALHFRELIINSTGQNSDEQVPMDRSIPLGVRHLLIALKRDLDTRHIQDMENNVHL